MKKVAAKLNRRDFARLGGAAIRILAFGVGRRIARGNMAERNMTDEPDRRPSTLGLIGDAITQASRLVSSEVILAKTELGEKMAAALVAIVSIAVAAIFLMVSLIFFLQALVEWLVELGWRPSIASLMVGGGISLVAVVAIIIAGLRLASWRLAPSRAIEQASRTVDAVRGKNG